MTVGELDERMSSLELLHWQMLYRIEAREQQQRRHQSSARDED